MNISELIKNGASNVMLSVTPADLQEFALEIVRQCRSVPAEKENDESYLSRKETLARLRCSDASLWRWQKEGVLVPVKVGAMSLYRLSDVRRLLKEI